MSMWSAYIEKRWYVVKQSYSYGLTTTTDNKNIINSEPLTFNEANNFRNVLNKLT